MAAAAESNDEEIRRKLQKPVCAADATIPIARSLFGLEIDPSSIKPLDSYDDLNFYVRGVLLPPSNAENGNGDEASTAASASAVRAFTLKIHNGCESDNIESIHAQNATLSHLAAHGFCTCCPLPVLPAQQNAMLSDTGKGGGEQIGFVELTLKDGSRKRHAVRLLEWVAGTVMSSTTPSEAILIKAGAYLAGIHNCFESTSFDHAGAHRVHAWDLNNTHLIQQFVPLIADDAKRKLVEDVLRDFREQVLPLIEGGGKKSDSHATGQGSLRRGILQADFNDANIILNEACDNVLGVIDFGDVVHR